MRQITLVLALVAAGAGSARADWATDNFKHFTRADDVRDTQTLEIRGGGLYTHAVIGYARSGESWHPRVVLMECTPKRCNGKVVYLGDTNSTLEWGLVDLAGRPTPLAADRRISPYDRSIKLATRGMRWPALVIETTRETRETTSTRFRKNVKGVRRERDTAIISLRRRDKSPRVFSQQSLRRSAANIGTSSSYRLIRPKHRGALQIEQSERRLTGKSLCLPPKPVITIHQLEGERFAVRTGVQNPGGCRGG
jgi:hypothetical protein